MAVPDATGARPALVVKQTELGEKADVGERHILANQETPLRAKRLLDAGEIGFEALPGPRMQFGRDGAAQREKIVLSIAREDEARIEKSNDARSLIGVSAVKGKAILPQPSNSAHDAVRLEDANGAVRAESRGTLPKGCASRKALVL
jgi:hypothetical protein